MIGSPGYPFDEERVREIAGRSYDRGHSAAGIVRQLHAITASGDRTQALRELDVPATVIHGNSDPLVRPAGGRATAKAIPGARLKMIEGMGHDLPRELWPDFVEEIAANAAARRRQAGRRPSRPRPPIGHWTSDAAERSRTFTGSRPHGPEPCASTSSATAAGAGNLPVARRAPPPRHPPDRRLAPARRLAKMPVPRRYRLGD